MSATALAEIFKSKEPSGDLAIAMRESNGASSPLISAKSESITVFPVTAASSLRSTTVSANAVSGIKSPQKRHTIMDKLLHLILSHNA